MEKKRIALIIGGGICALLLSACEPQQASPTPAPTPPDGGGQIANPAATFCVEKGYVWQVRTASDGSQSGVCIFPDGSECDEWAFFRGTCGPPTTPSSTLGAIQKVSIQDIGLAFELPSSWVRRGDDPVWAPGGDSTGTVGIVWGQRQPGQEPEAILPANAVMKGRTEGPQFDWGTAATYKLEVMVPGGQGQVKAIETHVLVRRGELLCDFYASGATEDELTRMETTLQSLLSTVTWSQ